MQMRVRFICGVAIATLVGCTSSRVWAQDAMSSGVTKPQMMAKDDDPDWEVITVKPSNPKEKRDRIDIEGRHVIVKNETVEAMLVTGFSVQKSQIADVPDWVRTERWDVNGIPNVEGQPDVQQLQSMLRKLLEERFGLTLHHEQREMSVFALTTARGGPKLTENPSNPKGLPGRDVRAANGQMTNTFTNTSMSDLALMLVFYTDRPIVDKTGLKGRYNFKLQWTMDEGQTAAPDVLPGLFTAVQEQLGLKLDQVKAAADVLVVDHVQKPGAN